MIDTAFMHFRNVRNVGDLACTPGHYFDLGRAEFVDIRDQAPACTRAVIGGGQIFKQAVDAVIYGTQHARRKIIWGVGIGPKDVASLPFDILSAGCDLVSTRNWGIGGVEHVPCASAMSSLFDAPPAPQHQAVLFAHAGKSKDLARVPGMPEMTNHDVSFQQAIAFLASAETVVTNSYHGTYWAMCLGRRVLCVPFSRKFRFFKDNPVFAQPDTWPQQLNRAEKRPEMLPMARALNQAFYEKLRNLD